MKFRWLAMWIFALSGFAVHAQQLRAPSNEPRLTPEDVKFLDGLMKDFLFDPAGAERVAIQPSTARGWGHSENEMVEGWLVPARDGKPARIYFTDGASVAAPPEKDIRRIDYVGNCAFLYAPRSRNSSNQSNLNSRSGDLFQRKRMFSSLDNGDLVDAAWLHRLGYSDLAVQALKFARAQEGDPRKRLCTELAKLAYDDMAKAYSQSEDAAALAHSERLRRKYPDDAKAEEFAQTSQIVDEIKRRQRNGTFGKALSKQLPDGFDKWDDVKKRNYLIASLEDAPSANSNDWPGSYSSHLHILALANMKEAAVPALIDVLEKDRRLSRWVNGRGYANQGVISILSVREIALDLLVSILGVRVFDVRSGAQDLPDICKKMSIGGDEDAKAIAVQIRAYWNEYGRYPFDARMMKILTDGNAVTEARHEAAWALSTLAICRHIGVWTTEEGSADEGKRSANPAIAKFRQPTTAEAMLAALDDEVRAYYLKPPAIREAADKERAEDVYLHALRALDDRCIAPEIARRAAASAEIHDRRLWAQLASDLGQSEPVRRLLEDFRLGRIQLPIFNPEGELEELIRLLEGCELPEASRAFESLLDPQHPLHVAATQHVVGNNFSSGRGWFCHPYCLSILRAALEDRTPTGGEFRIDGEYVTYANDGCSSSSTIPDFLSKPNLRRERTPERVCDAAALKLCALVAGVPLYHPLFNDAEDRLAKVRLAFDRFAGAYRLATHQEMQSSSYTLTAFLPDIRPLGRPATSDDVKAHRAIFELNGHGRVAEMKLPAVAVLKSEKDKEPARPLFVVQAEYGPDGLIYGVIGEREVRTISAKKVDRVIPVAEAAR